jgi:hypothetical protein
MCKEDVSVKPVDDADVKEPVENTCLSKEELDDLYLEQLEQM